MIERERPGDEPPTPKDKSKQPPEDRKVALPRPQRPERYPDPVDNALDDSFPASDPPSWWGR